MTLNIHRCNTNYEILNIHQYNINYGILNASRIQAKEILNAVLPEYPTEILNAPGINITKILNALKHTC
jgi:hypothetical protein